MDEERQAQPEGHCTRGKRRRLSRQPSDQEAECDNVEADAWHAHQHNPQQRPHRQGHLVQAPIGGAAHTEELGVDYGSCASKLDWNDVVVE